MGNIMFLNSILRDVYTAHEKTSWRKEKMQFDNQPHILDSESNRIESSSCRMICLNDESNDESSDESNHHDVE